MYLSSSVDAIYGELSEMRDFVAWLNESTEQHSYIVTTEDKFVFEVVRYLDTDFDYHDGLTLFMVFLAVRIDDERVKRQSVLLLVICMWQSTDFIGTNVDKIDKSTKQNQYD